MRAANWYTQAIYVSNIEKLEVFFRITKLSVLQQESCDFASVSFVLDVCT